MSGRSVNSVLVGLVCLTITSAISCTSIGSSSDHIIMCLESERHALLHFKQRLVDESNALASWKSEENCCKWRGIACDYQTGHVTNLNLSISLDAHFNIVASGLRGEIHPSLLELRYLNYLDLSFNDFGGGMIPEFIGSLSQLKELKLVAANFSGHVPPHLGNLTNLQTLDISYNEDVSSENLEWLSHLSSLRYLDMSGLDFSKVVNWPRSLSKLTSLTYLMLASCGLPDVNLRSSLSYINSTTSLQLLDLSSNSLNSSIFYWIANVSINFVHIQLFDNQLRGSIPSDVFTDMLGLVTLDLGWNQLEGGIPKTFQNLCSLESLDLMGNQLSENIKDSVNTVSCAKNTLETLVLGGNQFLGSFPDLTRFSKLRELDVGRNKLDGYLPESVGQLSSLEQLSISGNLMTGAITESLFRNLSRLRTLEISGNRFSINLSSDWNPPFQLTGQLDMSSYKLGPAFPKWILTQSNLTGLYLFNCGLAGSLPNEFWDIFSAGLFQLYLSMNQLDGNLPNLSATSLSNVDLSSNLFSGAIPSFSPNLRELNLSNNMLSEPSSSFCATRAPYLGMIDISNNLLSGVLPDCWMQFQFLEALFLENNSLSGNIPSSLGNLTRLKLLRLNGNNFSGELPSLENCTELLMIDLGSNNLSGKIPTWIGQSLSNLVILRLRSNEFNGIIPFSLCGLGIIHVLDLSHNNISGALPHCFNNITAVADDFAYAYMVVDIMWKGIEIEFGNNLWHLRSIDISSNSLVGGIPESIISMQNLISLNLSRNRLAGNLPENFGNMKKLESLDLSRNQISGHIPSSFSRLNFLGVLDLSYNQLSGRIPTGTQLQSFNASAYTGNLGLCGLPLTPNCAGDETTTQDGQNKEHDDDDGHKISLGIIVSSASLGFG